MKNSKIDGLLILTRNNIYKKLIFFCICLLLGCCSLYGVDNVSDSAALMTVYLTFWTYCVRGRRMSYVKGCLFDWFRNGQREGYLWEFFLFVQVILFKRKNWSFIKKNLHEIYQGLSSALDWHWSLKGLFCLLLTIITYNQTSIPTWLNLELSVTFWCSIIPVLFHQSSEKLFALEVYFLFVYRNSTYSLVAIYITISIKA